MKEIILTDAFDNSDKIIINEEYTNLDRRCITISCNIGKIFLDETAAILLKSYLEVFVDKIK